MKQMVSLMLVLTMVLSLFAGCGSTQTEEKMEESMVAATTAEISEPTTEPTTEPALSPEEVLYNSLPDRMKQAVDVGIVELSQLEDLNRECTIEEAAQMLQNAFTLRNGTKSKLLTDVMALDCAGEPAYLGWIGRLPIAMYLEVGEPENYQDYDQWINYVNKLTKESAGLEDLLYSNGSDGYSCWDGDNLMVKNGFGWYEIGWTTGMTNYFYRNMPEGNALLDNCVGQGNLLACSTWLFDRTTGHKVVEVSIYDEIPVEQIMTAGDMAEMALRMYHAFYQEQELAPYEDCTVADPAILTEELLSRETDLPDASCSNLPDQWHGVTMDEVSLLYIWNTEHYTAEIYEYEIQAIQDAGFNYIGLQIDFSWLQGWNQLSRKDPLDGQLVLTRLKKLDQILAWCMERDIHLDIRCTGAGGMIPNKQNRWTASDDTAEEFAKIWSVLAQRYADVPNTYLSFTVVDNLLTYKDFTTVADNLGGLEAQKALVAFIKPSVEAIREATPDRCIIVDLSGFNVGTDILELEVALSADLTAIESEFFVLKPENKKILDPNHYLGVQWPYKEGQDAESMLYEDQYWKDGSTIMRVMELAQENNLGFMFGGWGGMRHQYKGAYFCTTRYPDATYEAFITDMTETMERYGFGWCYEEWYGHNGITFSVPIMKNVTYEQIGDYPMYYDTAMLGWFQEVNGVK